MAFISVAERTIHCQIVYYGFPMSGRSTSLVHIHKEVGFENRSNIDRLNNPDSIHFSYVQPERFKGFSIHFHLKCHLGVTLNPDERVAILDKADGIVFVVDSLKNRVSEGERAYKDILSAIRAMGRTPESFPVVLQYNKRDLPEIVPVALLDRKFHQYGWPRFETIATTGHNIMPAFDAIRKNVLSAL